jgi:hypothetical protein
MTLPKICIGGAYLNLLTDEQPTLSLVLSLSRNLLVWAKDIKLDEETTLQDYIDGPKGLMGIAKCTKCSVWRFISRDTMLSEEKTEDAFRTLLIRNGKHVIHLECASKDSCEGGYDIDGNVWEEALECFDTYVDDKNMLIMRNNEEQG